MRYFSLVIATLLTLLCFSQKKFVQNFPNSTTPEITGYKSGGKKVGQWIYYHPDGKLKKIESYKNDSLTGIYAEFDEKGEIRRRTVLKQGFFAGPEYTYENGQATKKTIYLTKSVFNTNENSARMDNPFRGVETRVESYDQKTGILRALAFYKEGVKDSVHVYFDDKGAMRANETYKMGQRTGRAKRFYPDGSIAEQCDFTNGKMNGKRIRLATNGDTVEYGNYTNDIRNGYFTITENVAVPDLTEDQKSFKIYGKYDNGVKSGPFTLKYQNNALAGTENYANDQLTGERKLYNEAGKLVFEGSFDMNKRIGIHKKYYPSGKLMQVTNYKSNQPEGEQLTYFESGKVSEKAIFENGQIKELTRFYENGKVRQKMTYSAGKMVSQESFDERGKKV